MGTLRFDPDSFGSRKNDGFMIPMVQLPVQSPGSLVYAISAHIPYRLFEASQDKSSIIIGNSQYFDISFIP